MPIVKSDGEGQPPREPHLAVMTDTTGRALAIPVGATMLIIEDPTNREKVLPLMVAKVSRKQLVFRCACGNKACTRIYRFKVVLEGTHPNKFT